MTVVYGGVPLQIVTVTVLDPSYSRHPWYLKQHCAAKALKLERGNCRAGS